MEDKVKLHIEEYCRKNGWDVSDTDTKETLIEAKHIYEERTSAHRWYDVYNYVVDIDGMLIGFEYYESKDENNSPEDMELDFDFDKVYEMHPVEKTMIVYERRGD